jgi:serine/threonine-protein kinase
VTTIGRYRLGARLGRGGMAELFVGQLVGAGGFEKLVAIKRMLPHLSEDPHYVQMFINEGRIAAALTHPNLCQVYELGEANGQLFLAMELLRGLPWSDIVPAIPDHPPGPLVRFVVGMLVQACEGLYHAHHAADLDGKPHPIVHRDVSPSNLMITTEGIVKLLDFGVSKVLTEEHRTRTGMLKGKIPYMSPEQIRNQPLDASSDIFSLGAVAWEALAGRALFDRPSDFEIFQAVLEDDLPALPAQLGELDAVVRRALSRDREGRYGDARAFADELRRAGEPYGAPMTASELASHVQLWLGDSLARRSRDLADVVAHLRGVEPATTPDAPRPSLEVTTIHVGAPEPGVRLRDQSLVVDPAENAPTTERAATTLEHPAPELAVTAPRAIIAPEPAPRPPPIVEEAAREVSWIPAVVVAILAIATGVIIALWA